MIFEQHYLECLSQASYLIGDETTGRAVVVDPRRDITEYLASAAEHGLRIELVIETHFHADFLSGHLELAAATGAAIAYGAVAHTEFPSQPLADHERILLGEVVLEVLHTPGHTPESISIVVWEHADDEAPFAVLTGDTLFVGDVGRPDLLATEGVTADELAGALHDSLHRQLLTLDDRTRVYPAHGAGSACGKNLSTDTWSTIGEQRATTYALRPMTKEAFVAAVTDGQSAPPAYFSFDARRNREHHDLLDETAPPESLSLDEVVARRADGAVVVDTREPNEFAVGHLAGSINVGLGGRYAEFVGGVVEPDATIILVTEPGRELEAKNRLARIGFDRVIGHLADPLDAFERRPEESQRSSRIDVTELRRRLDGDVHGALQLVDVRQPAETAHGIIPGAIELPLTRLGARLGELEPARPTVVYCAGGYRSSIAASRMAAAGFADVADLLGGFAAWDSTAVRASTKASSATSSA